MSDYKIRCPRCAKPYMSDEKHECPPALRPVVQRAYLHANFEGPVVWERCCQTESRTTNERLDAIESLLQRLADKYL